VVSTPPFLDIFDLRSFELLAEKLIVYTQSALKREDFKKTEDVFNRVMNRDDIAVACLLRHKLDGYKLVVANAHFFWDPAFSDVKLVQAGMLMEELQDLFPKWSAKRKDDPPPRPGGPDVTGKTALVVCVDMNSTPDSGVYEFISRGTLRGDHPDFKGHRYGRFTEGGMAHPFSLRSAYAQGPNGGELLPFTNYTPGFQGVIDYIWYSTTGLGVEAVMDGPETAYIENVVGFPDPHFPSEYPNPSPPPNPSSTPHILVFCCEW
jgi:CCR4-NOT transcription complex subunit 6